MSHHFFGVITEYDLDKNISVNNIFEKKNQSNEQNS